MDGLKQRVIGAVVLVSLAIIFIPMIFETPHQDTEKKVIPIPKQPEPPAFTIELPNNPEANSNQGNRNSQTMVSSSQTSVGKIDRGAGNGTISVSKQPSAEQIQTISPPSKKSSQSSEPSIVETRNVLTAKDKSASIEKTPVAKNEAAPPVKTAKPEPNAEKAKVKQASIEQGWAVQIGTFKNKQGAKRLKANLKESGTPHYSQDILSGDIEMIRVYAGPVEDKGAAEKLKKELDKKYKVKSLIVRYKKG